jgi:hypothetical protein
MRTFYQPEGLGAELEDLYSWLSTDSGAANSKYSAGRLWIVGGGRVLSQRETRQSCGQIVSGLLMELEDHNC